MAELYHLGVPTSAVPRLAILVDPLLGVASVAGATGGRALASRREYVSFLGAWDDQEIVVTTVGIGAPPLAIAIEELARSGTEAMVLLGTATFFGVPTRWLLPHGAARGDGTSGQYAPPQFPAVPDPRLRTALAGASGTSASHGLVETVDVLDAEEPTDGPAAGRDLRCAALYVVAAVRGVRAAALLTEPPGGEGNPRTGAVDDMAVAACRALTGMDEGRGEP